MEILRKSGVCVCAVGGGGGGVLGFGVCMIFWKIGKLIYSEMAKNALKIRIVSRLFYIM